MYKCIDVDYVHACTCTCMYIDCVSACMYMYVNCVSESALLLQTIPSPEPTPDQLETTSKTDHVSKTQSISKGREGERGRWKGGGEVKGREGREYMTTVKAGSQYESRHASLKRSRNATRRWIRTKFYSCVANVAFLLPAKRG